MAVPPVFDTADWLFCACRGLDGLNLKRPEFYFCTVLHADPSVARCVNRVRADVCSIVFGRRSHFQHQPGAGLAVGRDTTDHHGQRLFTGWY
jgi:hypothetical protein